MAKYHISKAGNVVLCRATKRPCTAQPPEELEQVHSDDPEQVYKLMSYQYNDIHAGLKRPKRPPLGEVTDELVGAPETDGERLTVSNEKTHRRDKSYQLWLHDTQGRPMGFLQVNIYQNGRLGLCDIEVRPEYRGRGLSKRLIKAAEEHFGKEMTHEGGYTPEGFAAVAPLFHEGEELEAKGGVHLYEPMTFVEDWERAWPKYPL